MIVFNISLMLSACLCCPGVSSVCSFCEKWILGFVLKTRKMSAFFYPYIGSTGEKPENQQVGLLDFKPPVSRQYGNKRLLLVEILNKIFQIRWQRANEGFVLGGEVFFPVLVFSKKTSSGSK